MSQKRATFILGPHRSGTSCLAGALRVMGLYLGPDYSLGDAQADNPKGFFEHLPMVAINDEILQRLGGDWCTVPSFPPGWQSSHMFSDIRSKASHIVTDNFGGHDSWGFKDPRASLTIPFWRTIITYPIRCIIMVRNPLEVAHSLLKRNCMPIDKSSKLWLAHIYSAMAGSRGKLRKIVFFDRLVQDPAGQLAEAADFSGLPRDKAALERGVAWVERDLKHHNMTWHDTRDSKDIPAEVKKAWSAMRLFSHMENKGEAVRKDEDLLLGVLSGA